jgi:hypothetical protein
VRLVPSRRRDSPPIEGLGRQLGQLEVGSGPVVLCEGSIGGRHAGAPGIGRRVSPPSQAVVCRVVGFLSSPSLVRVCSHVRNLDSFK